MGSSVVEISADDQVDVINVVLGGVAHMKAVSVMVIPRVGQGKSTVDCEIVGSSLVLVHEVATVITGLTELSLTVAFTSTISTT